MNETARVRQSSSSTNARGEHDDDDDRQRVIALKLGALFDLMAERKIAIVSDDMRNNGKRRIISNRASLRATYAAEIRDDHEQQARNYLAVDPDLDLSELAEFLEPEWWQEPLKAPDLDWSS